MVGWYLADARTLSPSFSRTFLYSNIIGVAGGEVAFQFFTGAAELFGFKSARVTGYLEPGPGPSERELALRQSDIEDTESRCRPAGAIYLTRVNATIVSTAYLRWSKNAASEGSITE